ARDNSGKTPLHTAVIAEDYYTLDFIEFLLMKKAKLNLRDHEGKTALQLALTKGDRSMIQLLKRYGGKV
ncbi:MAG: ankyrin repeat domain-containing protein, partial [Nostocales cyanobacterium]